MSNDLQFAFRTLSRAPGFTAVAILSLALGIGANTAIFSLLYQVVLQPLPVKDPQSLVSLQDDKYSFGWDRQDSNSKTFSFPMYQALRDRNQVFDGLIGRATFAADLSYYGNAIATGTELVTGNFFSVLGVRPLLGRLLLPSDDRVNAQENVVVLGYRFGSNHLGQRRAVLHQRVLINGHPMLIVGVAPSNFHSIVSGRDPDLYAPVSSSGLLDAFWTVKSGPDHYWLSLFGRLKPGVSEAQANASLSPLFLSIFRDELSQFKGVDAESRKKILLKTVKVQSAAQGFNQLQLEWQAPLTVLMAMVGLVLLMACINVANLLIARGAGREREFAIRLAVGATKFQVFRQLLVESLVLSCAGGLLGLFSSGVITRGLLHVVPSDVFSGWLSTQLNWAVLWFSFALALLTGLVFGFAPALQAVKPALALALKERTSGISASSSKGRFRRFLVAAQVCLSLVLLVGAGLFTRSVLNLLSSDPGFKIDRLVTFQVDPMLAGYTHTRSFALYRELGEKLESIPGVRSVARANLLPLGNAHMGNGISTTGNTADSAHNIDVSEEPVGPGYFHTLGIPLIAGRLFTEGDNGPSSHVMIVNETLAHKLFPSDSAIGHHVRMGSNNEDFEIVGIVKDSKFNGLRQMSERLMYIPDEREDITFTTQSIFFLRTSGKEQSVMTAVPKIVKRLDPSLPVSSLTTMKDFVDNTIYTDRLMAILAIAFGVLATTLAAVGLYGIISYAVTRRTQEFGIRLALGAERGNIVGLVIREIAWLVAIGIFIGLPASYGLGILIESQLFGIRSYDPLVLLGATLVLIVSAALAGLLPTLRAMRIEPTQALRYE